MINSIERFLTYVSDGDEEKTKIITSIYGLINEHENKIFEIKLNMLKNEMNIEYEEKLSEQIQECFDLIRDVIIKEAVFKKYPNKVKESIKNQTYKMLINSEEFKGEYPEFILNTIIEWIRSENKKYDPDYYRDISLLGIHKLCLEHKVKSPVKKWISENYNYFKDSIYKLIFMAPRKTEREIIKDAEELLGREVTRAELLYGDFDKIFREFCDMLFSSSEIWDDIHSIHMRYCAVRRLNCEYDLVKSNITELAKEFLNQGVINETNLKLRELKSDNRFIKMHIEKVAKQIYINGDVSYYKGFSVQDFVDEDIKIMVDGIIEETDDGIYDEIRDKAKKQINIELLNRIYANIDRYYSEKSQALSKTRIFEDKNNENINKIEKFLKNLDLTDTKKTEKIMDIYKLIRNNRKKIFEYRKELKEHGVNSEFEEEPSKEIQKCIEDIRSSIKKVLINKIGKKKNVEEIANKIIEGKYDKNYDDDIRSSINKTINLKVLNRVFTNLGYYYLNEIKHLRESILKTYEEEIDGITLE